MTQTLVIADRIVTGIGPDGEPEVLENAAILVDGDTISAIGPSAELRRDHPDALQIGGSGFVEE